jgi:type IV secretion system protein VirD4
MNSTLDRLNIILSKLGSLRGQGGQLHHARFALPHELKDLTSHNLDEEALLLGRTHLGGIYRVRKTPSRRELGNCLVLAPTGGGKGLLATSQILTWPGSMIIFDLKGDLYTQTAGYRKTLGPVYRFDTRGRGHTYDPLDGLTDDDRLYAVAQNLLYDPKEGEGRGFTEKAIRMLVLAWQAGMARNRLTGERCRLLPWTRHLAELGGINQAGAAIHAVSPPLARRMLDGDYDGSVDYNERKYLANSFESGVARLYPVLTERISRCFNGADFTARDIIAGANPVTVYICVPEGELKARAPVLRLVIESLFSQMLSFADEAPGETPAEKGIRPVLVLLDEAGTIGLPNLPTYTATCRSRGISIWAAFQDNSQIEMCYRGQAKAIRNNMAAKVFYQQDEYETAKAIADALGVRSGFSRSETLRDGEVASEGRSETAIPLFTAQDIRELAEDDVIILFKNLKPGRGRRMDWRASSTLIKRRSLPPPPLTELPPVADITRSSAPSSENGTTHAWSNRGNGLRFPIDPEDFN